MTRLIDADKLHDLFDKNCVGDCNVCNFYTSVHYVIHNKDCKGHSYCGLIDNAPTVDTDLSKYSDKLWEEAYERGKKMNCDRNMCFHNLWNDIPCEECPCYEEKETDNDKRRCNQDT